MNPIFAELIRNLADALAIHVGFRPTNGDELATDYTRELLEFIEAQKEDKMSAKWTHEVIETMDDPQVVINRYASRGYELVSLQTYTKCVTSGHQDFISHREVEVSKIVMKKLEG